MTCPTHNRALNGAGTCKSCYDRVRTIQRAAARGPARKVVLPSDEEFRPLLREHGSFAAVARVLQCSKSAVQHRCRKLGLTSPNRRGGRRTCDRCAVTSEHRKIEQFTLAVPHRRGRTPKTTFGSIFLCEPCWTATGARRQRKRVDRARIAA